MSGDRGTLLFVHEGATFRVADGAQPPKAGSLLFCRHLHAEPGARVLEIGTGIGLAAVRLALAGARVIEIVFDVCEDAATGGHDEDGAVDVERERTAAPVPD